jgi:hypothetical protein
MDTKRKHVHTGPHFSNDMLLHGEMDTKRMHVHTGPHFSSDKLLHGEMDAEPHAHDAADP